MAAFIKVAKKSDLPAGRGMVVEVEGREIALFNVDGVFHALDNVCCHRGGPLGEGMLSGHVVACPWHGWQFDVTTGKSPMIPEAEVEKLETCIEGEDVLVAV